MKETQRSFYVVDYRTVHWRQQKVLGYLYELNTRDPAWESSCEWPLLQCYSSSGSVGKSIWPELRRPRFKSWLDLNIFFGHTTIDYVSELSLNDPIITWSVSSSSHHQICDYWLTLHFCILLQSMVGKFGNKAKPFTHSIQWRESDSYICKAGVDVVFTLTLQYNSPAFSYSTKIHFKIFNKGISRSIVEFLLLWCGFIA